MRAITSGISRGTESLVFHGLVPASEYSRMRCPFQEGAFPFPVKYGYAMVGIVEDGPEARIGETVLCPASASDPFHHPAYAALLCPLHDRRTRSAGPATGDGFERALGCTRHARATGLPWSAAGSSAALSPIFVRAFRAAR